LEKFLKIGIALLLWAAWATGAQAAECAGITQADMNICQQTAFTQADKALNIAYQRLRQRVTQDQLRLLKTAETAWLQYRDVECQFESANSEGGSMHGMEVSACVTNLTKRRTADLERMASCKDGDTNCP